MKIGSIKLVFLFMVLFVAFQSRSVMAEEPQGLKVFKEHKCGSCHAMQAFGIAKSAEKDDEEEEGESVEAPDLSQGLSAETLRQPDAAAFLRDYLKKKIEKQENSKGQKSAHKHKKIFKGSKEELESVVAFIIESSSKKPKSSKVGASPSREKH